MQSRILSRHYDGNATWHIIIHMVLAIVGIFWACASAIANNSNMTIGLIIVSAICLSIGIGLWTFEPNKGRLSQMINKGTYAVVSIRQRTASPFTVLLLEDGNMEIRGYYLIIDNHDEVIEMVDEGRELALVVTDDRKIIEAVSTATQ